MNGIRPAVECRIGPTIRTNDSMSQPTPVAGVSAKTGEAPRRASSRARAAAPASPPRGGRDLSVRMSPPPAELAGWKDTIHAEPQREYELILRFEDYTDPDTPYMYHCHLLWHEDQGMMGQFAVVEPGQRATMTEETHDDHH